jgi:hypothetical protein
VQQFFAYLKKLDVFFGVNITVAKRTDMSDFVQLTDETFICVLKCTHFIVFIENIFENILINLFKK